MKDYDELIDFIENELGIKLSPYQKIMLKIIYEKDIYYVLRR